MADEKEVIKEEQETVGEQVPETETAPEAEEATVEQAEAPAEEKPEEKDGKKFGRKDKKTKKDEAAEAAMKAAAELAAANDKYLRLAAEYDNYRRRTQKEKDELNALIKKNTITEFLPVYDNLVRALDAPTEDEAYKKGVRMIMDQFMKTFDKLGVTKIESLGQTFDPNIHNAVMHVDDETKGENEIVQVFQEGFKVGDKIIRTPMVKVAN